MIFDLPLLAVGLWMLWDPRKTFAPVFRSMWSADNLTSQGERAAFLGFTVVYVGLALIITYFGLVGLIELIWSKA